MWLEKHHIALAVMPNCARLSSLYKLGEPLLTDVELEVRVMGGSLPAAMRDARRIGVANLV